MSNEENPRDHDDVENSHFQGILEDLPNESIENSKDKSRKDIEEEFEYQWHVLAVSKNREAALQRALLAMIDLPSRIVKEVYLPTEVVRQWKNNKQVDKEKAAMSYVFALSRPGHLNSRDIQNQIPGFRVIGTVSSKEIADMKSNFESKPPVVEFNLKVGSEVNILKGNLAGLQGQIQAIGADGCVTVRIWLMQGCEPTDIAVQIDEIGPVSEK